METIRSRLHLPRRRNQPDYSIASSVEEAVSLTRQSGPVEIFIEENESDSMRPTTEKQKTLTGEEAE